LSDGEPLFPCLLAPRLPFARSPSPGRCRRLSRKVLLDPTGLKPLAVSAGQGSVSPCVAARSVTAAGPGAAKAAGPGLALGVLVCSAKPLTRAVKRQTRTKITHGFSQP